MKNFESVQSWLIKGMAFLLPLFFLPFTSEFFEFNKMVLLAVATLLGIVVWSVSQLKDDFKFSISPFDLPVLAFAVVYTAAALIQTPNKVDAFVFPGTATIVVFGTLLYFLMVQYLRNEHSAKSSVLTMLLAGSALSAVITVVAGVGGMAMINKLIALPAWLNQNTFSTLGGVLPSLTLFVALLPAAATRATGSKEVKHSILNTFFLVCLVAGTAVGVYYVLPGKPTSPQLLPVSTGWGIALETLKRSPLLGFGPGNFVEAFNRFRPVEYNGTSVWNVRFGASSNWYLEVWTVSGLLGIAAFVWLVIRVAKQVKKGVVGPVQYSLLATLVVLALVPANLVLLVVFYLLLAHAAAPLAQEISLHFAAHNSQGVHYGSKRANLLAGFLALLALGGLVASGMYGSKVYGAEVSYRGALNAASKNDGRETYSQMINAINQNPNVDRYRITYSQVNFALANNIAANKNLTDQDRQTVSQLVQQAIREGQAAVSLGRGSAGNWENLARIYQSIMPLAKDADQFAIGSYQQSIALDPVNPLLRLSLGGLYYSLGKYDDAVKTFELAVAAKPDFANGHYNLAVALRDKGDTQRAAQEMSQVLALVSPGTKDYETAQGELDKLQKKLSEEASASAKVAGAKTQQNTQDQQQLQAPSPAPKQVVNPPLSLPEEAAPPATESGQLDQ